MTTSPKLTNRVKRLISSSKLSELEDNLNAVDELLDILFKERCIERPKRDNTRFNYIKAPLITPWNYQELPQVYGRIIRNKLSSD